MKKAYICILVAIAISVSVLYLSVFTVDDRNWVVITQFGKPVKTITEPGPYFKLPGFLQTINKFDKRINMFETQPIQLLLGDKNPVVISCYAAWQIQDPLLFFQVVGNKNNAENKLSDMVTSSLGIVLGDYNIRNIINIDKADIKIDEIEKAIKTESSARSEEKYGIKIIKTGIQRIAYPDIVMKSVYERMKSERRKEADKLLAEGQEEASNIHFEANKISQSINAKAKKNALIIKGEGDKAVMRIYSQAYNKDAEFFNLIRSLDMYKKIMADNTTLILSTESELFKYLDLGRGEEKK